jgi:hypothetical protein
MSSILLLKNEAENKPSNGEIAAILAEIGNDSGISENELVEAQIAAELAETEQHDAAFAAALANDERAGFAANDERAGFAANDERAGFAANDERAGFAANDERAELAAANKDECAANDESAGSSPKSTLKMSSAKYAKIVKTVTDMITFVTADLQFVEQGLSLALDDNQLSPESAAQLLGLFANLLSQLKERLNSVNGKSVYIKHTVEFINCIKTAVIFENTLKPFYDGVVLLPGSQKTLVDFITMGADFVKISIDYDSFFKEISFERMSIDCYFADCEENATKTMGSQLSPIAAKRRLEHVAMIPGIIRAIASYIRNGIGAACDDVFTGTLQVEISKRLSAIACYESAVQKAFSVMRSSDLIEEAAIKYASAISAIDAKTPIVAQENNISFVHIAKISKDLCAVSNKSPQRPKEPLNIELFNMANYNRNPLCTSCNTRTASTNMNSRNGKIGEPLFPICDDNNNFIGGLCQMCAYCVSNNNSWKTMVPMSTALIKGFFPFTKKSFEAKKTAIYEMRKAHLNCNRCKAVNGRVFHSRTNELKFGVYCLDCVTEVYRGMHGCYPSPRMENQELFEDFTFNQKEYLEALSARA